MLSFSLSWVPALGSGRWNWTTKTPSYFPSILPFGRYMFKQLPFGISSAEDMFQSVMFVIFKDTDDMKVAVDDVIVWKGGDH